MKSLHQSAGEIKVSKWNQSHLLAATRKSLHAATKTLAGKDKKIFLKLWYHGEAGRSLEHVPACFLEHDGLDRRTRHRYPDPLLLFPYPSPSIGGMGFT